MLTPPAHVTPDDAALGGAGDGGRLPGRPCMPRLIHNLMESECSAGMLTAGTSLTPSELCIQC